MEIDEIQNIIDYAYPKIQKYYGKGSLDIPKVELHRDIYARLSGDEEAEGEKDELYNKAVEIIKAEGKASTSFLQRKLQIGYNRAARIMGTMEKEGIVGQANHVGKREIL